jgi:hypothetical protein
LKNEKDEQSHDLFLLAEAIAPRDEGIAVTTDANESWHDSTLKIIARIPTGWTGIGEDLRRFVLDAGAGSPKHPNAWGALSMSAIKAGLFVQTGEYRKPQSVKSHARKCAVMQRC